MKVEDVAVKFVEAINSHVVDSLYELMSDDHLFIDGLGQTGKGREEMRTGWIEYFNMVPDFHIEVSEVIVSSNTVALFGIASGTYSPDGSTIKPENYWKVPAAWRAVISGDKIKEWQVFVDNEPIRQVIKRERANS